MTWVVVGGVLWTALVLLLGLYVGRAMARADRRTEDARRPPVPSTTGTTRAADHRRLPAVGRRPR